MNLKKDFTFKLKQLFMFPDVSNPGVYLSLNSLKFSNMPQLQWPLTLQESLKQPHETAQI